MIKRSSKGKNIWKNKYFQEKNLNISYKVFILLLKFANIFELKKFSLNQKRKRMKNQRQHFSAVFISVHWCEYPLVNEVLRIFPIFFLFCFRHCDIHFYICKLRRRGMKKSKNIICENFIWCSFNFLCNSLLLKCL